MKVINLLKNNQRFRNVIVTGGFFGLIGYGIYDLNKTDPSLNKPNLKSIPQIQNGLKAIILPETPSKVPENDLDKSNKKDQNIMQVTPKQDEVKLEQNEVKPEQNIIQQKKPVAKAVRIGPFRSITEIQQFDLQTKIEEDEMVVIVADLPYTKKFEQKLVNQINKMERVHNKKIKIYKKNIIEEDVKSELMKKYKSQIKEETIFLVKNRYEGSMINIDFDMYMQFPNMLEVFLRELRTYDSRNIIEFTKLLGSMGKHETCLMYLYDATEDPAKVQERMMTAKFIEMELNVHQINHIKVYALERQAAHQAGLILPQKSRVNSLHLIRKHNEFTHADANFYLQTQSSSEPIPYHNIPDISLYNKRQITIKNYLNQVETFSSKNIMSPFICSLKIDRNRIKQDEFQEILRHFAVLKRTNTFQNVSFILSYGSINYPGKDKLFNKSWSLSLVNLQKLQLQTSLHEISTVKELQESKISEAEYNLDSFEYKYHNTVLNQSLLRQFITLGINGSLKPYYKSEEKDILSDVNKVVGSTFTRDILQNSDHHLLYEYSEHCSTCKQISPIFTAFANLINADNQLKGEVNLGLGLNEMKIHRINCNKNRTKEQHYSPYVPNLYFFKKEWKHDGPVRFPLEHLQSNGLVALYQFCKITKDIQSIPWQEVDQMMAASRRFDLRELM